MFEILAKFFRFSGKENENKFKLSIVIGLAEALASAMKIPAIMYVLIGLISKETMGKYIIGSIAIMGIAVTVDIICKRFIIFYFFYFRTHKVYCVENKIKQFMMFSLAAYSIKGFDTFFSYNEKKVFGFMGYFH